MNDNSNITVIMHGDFHTRTLEYLCSNIEYVNTRTELLFLTILLVEY